MSDRKNSGIGSPAPAGDWRERAEALARSGEVCRGRLERLHREKGGRVSLHVSSPLFPGGELCFIPPDEADDDYDKPWLAGLLDRQIPFVVLGAEEGGQRVVCSRKQAQQKLKQKLYPKLRRGLAVQGRVIAFTRYGCRVEYGGLVGHLRSGDLTDDFSSCREHLETGSLLQVRCREILDNGFLFWEAVTRLSRRTPVVCPFREGDVVTGRVTAAVDFPAEPGVFVTLRPGLDALCRCREGCRAVPGRKAAVQILSVSPGSGAEVPRVKGLIVDLL